MSKLGNAAIQYAEKGWAVFPLSIGSKIPMKGSGGVKDATKDRDLVATLWDCDPYANIGLACGAKSGVYVVDIDVNHKGGADGFASLAEAGIELPKTLCARTPNGGLHLFYKCVVGEKPKTGAKVNGLSGVDVRADGGYVVLAPSKVSNKPYVWENEGEELAEFPEVLKPQAKKREAVKPVSVQPIVHTPTRGEILERASAYLSTCDGAVQGAGGHNTLLRVAAALTIGFNLSDAEALNLLWSEYNPRCIPPWDAMNGSERRDFERKVTESRKDPRHPIGYLLEVENPVWDGAAELGAAFAAELLANSENVEVVEAIDEVETEEEDEETPETAVIPAEILDPPGLVGDIARWIRDTSLCYQPLFAVGAAVTFCGALFGRKVKDEYDTRTNIYGLCIGQSSSGKDYPQKTIQKILAAVGDQAEKMLAKEVTSDAAIMSALKNWPTRIFIWDEVGHFFTNMKQGKDAYLKTIRPVLLQLFSSANMPKFKGKQMADKEEAVSVEYPHVCIWGATSPDILFENMSPGEITDGFIGRFLTFVSHTRPLPEMKKASVVPEIIVERVMAWVTRKIDAPEGAGQFDAIMKQHQMIVPTTQGAVEALNAFRVECHKKMCAIDADGDVTNNLWSKAAEIAGRVALTVACGRNFDAPEVARCDVEYATALVRYCVTTFADEIRGKLSESPWEKMRLKIEKCLKQAGGKGLGSADLGWKLRSIKGDDRKKLIADLISDEIVILKKSIGKTKPTLRYYHADFMKGFNK